MLGHHTDCGMLTFTDEEITAQLEADTGVRPEWPPRAFADLDEDVRRSVERITVDPFVPHTDSVREFVCSVTDGTLREVR